MKEIFYGKWRYFTKVHKKQLCLIFMNTNGQKKQSILKVLVFFILVFLVIYTIYFSDFVVKKKKKWPGHVLVRFTL